MSATRDKSQKITFVYSNLYELYKKGLDAAKNAEGSGQQSVDANDLRGVTTGTIIKAGDVTAVHTPVFAKPKVSAYRPVELVSARIADRMQQEQAQQHQQEQAARKPVIRPAELYRSRNASQDQALAGLKQNLRTLGELHARLKFMLKELHDLVQEE